LITNDPERTKKRIKNESKADQKRTEPEPKVEKLSQPLHSKRPRPERTAKSAEPLRITPFPAKNSVAQKSPQSLPSHIHLRKPQQNRKKVTSVTFFHSLFRASLKPSTIKTT
jgi:hypothetical protein